MPLAFPPEERGEIWQRKTVIKGKNGLKKAAPSLPGVVVPVTLHKGQPIGVQLIAGRYREDLALDAAAAIEKRAGILVPRLWEKMG